MVCDVWCVLCYVVLCCVVLLCCVESCCVVLRCMVCCGVLWCVVWCGVLCVFFLFAPAVCYSKRGPNIKEYWEKVYIISRSTTIDTTDHSFERCPELRSG